jgi:SAM-dependent methyltransferase
MSPRWAGLVSQAGEEWAWKGERLVHRDATPMPTQQPTGPLQRFMVKYVYADHNLSKAVRSTISALQAEVDRAGGWGVNIGAGDTRMHDRLINVDVADNPTVDIVAADSRLPFDDKSIDLVVSQEAIEHIADFGKTIEEVARICKPGAAFYCQAPFIIGFHPGPSDYWRFSRQAFELLFDNETWSLEKLEISVGFGTGFYRILVEFLATLASAIHARLYIPAKGASALLFYWVKLFDVLSPRAAQRDRIPGGYFVVARRRPEAPAA